MSFGISVCLFVVLSPTWKAKYAPKQPMFVAYIPELNAHWLLRRDLSDPYIYGLIIAIVIVVVMVEIHGLNNSNRNGSAHR